MKIRISLFIAACVFLVSCDNPQSKEDARATQDSLLQVQQDSLLDLFKGELEAIAGKVNEVSATNGLFSIDTAETSVLSKESILGKVESLDDLLQSNRKELNDLYKRMKSNKIKNDQLEQMVKGMQGRIAEREEQIAELMKMLQDKDMKIEQVLGKVDSMRLTTIELTEEVIKMDEEMHLVYYIVDDAKSLKEDGLVTKEGGLLGIGASKKLDVSQLDKSLFKEVDQRDLQNIPVFSKKARLITNHPEASYEMVMDSEGKVESLNIVDRKSFWTATDYLVIEVSN